MSTITVIRPDKMFNSGVSLYVFCDDKQVGKIKNNQSCQFEVDDGNHKLEIGHQNSDGSHICADSKTLQLNNENVVVNISVSFMGFKIDSINYK